jgi:hypothetical protein
LLKRIGKNPKALYIACRNDGATKKQFTDSSRESGIVVGSGPDFVDRFLPDSEIELKDVTNIRDRGLETFTPERLFYVLVDMREIVDMSAEARAFVASKENAKYHSALAMVVNSLTSRILGNVYIRMNRPERPTRMFNTLKEAHQWLIHLRNNNPNYNRDY